MGGITMNISKRAAHYLRDTDVDFHTFYILDIVVQSKKDAVVILAPRDPDSDRYFSVQYKGKKYGFQSIGHMMDVLVEGKYLSRFAADRLIHKFNTHTEIN